MEERDLDGMERETVHTGSGPVELPILYNDTLSIASFFAAPTAGVKELLPSPSLAPVELWPGKSTICFIAFSHHQASIGHHREFWIAIPSTYQQPYRSYLLPALRMAASLSFQLFVWKLPVTTQVALDIGREIWGYPKMLAEIDFSEDHGRVICRVAEGGAEVATMRVGKTKANVKTYLDFNTFTVKDQGILWTPVKCLAGGLRRSFRPGASSLSLGNHALAERLSEIGLSRKALMTLYIPHLQMMLPRPEAQYSLRESPGRPGVTPARDL